MNEKGPLLHHEDPPIARRARATWRRLLPLAILVLLALHTADRQTRQHRKRSGLHWKTCPDDKAFQCAYLDAPMNYHDAKNKRRVSIALRKLPATCSKKAYKGSLLIEPGGPGGSGHAFAVRVGPYLSKILDHRYDIIGFDPRGVNLTTPSWKCLQGESGAAAGSLLRHLTSPINGRNGSLEPLDQVTPAEGILYDRSFAMQEAIIEGCLQTGDVEMIKSSSTAFLVRDMARLLDALGETKLNYWGFSYGTAVGSTFAAMFPDRVGRIVLDGNDNARMWNDRFDEGAIDSLQDTHKVWEGFLRNCATQPDACAFAQPPSSAVASTAEELQERVKALFQHAAQHPYSVPISRFGPGFVDATAIQQNIWKALYFPILWPRLAESLAEMESGNATKMYEIWASAGKPDTPTPPHFGGHSREAPIGQNLQFPFVGCLDGNSTVNRLASREAKIEYARKIQRVSFLGEIWASRVFMRSHCTLEPFEAYSGPWTRKDGLKKLARPILFVNNVADPCTPLASAQSIARGFGNDSASVLINEGYGHTSMSQPSLCAAKAVKAYLLDGSLPADGAICDVQNEWPFKQLSFEGLDAQDTKLLHTLEDLSSSFLSK